jgi:hypothetical protein
VLGHAESPSIATRSRVPSAGKNQSFVAASVRTQSARWASAQRLEDAMKFVRPFQHLAVAVMTLLVSAAVPHIGRTAEFTLMPNPQTVHIGHFAANLKPVLSIESGDTVTIETSSLFAPEIIDQSGVVLAKRNPAIPARNISRGEGSRALWTRAHWTNRDQGRDAR